MPHYLYISNGNLGVKSNPLSMFSCLLVIGVGCFEKHCSFPLPVSSQDFSFAVLEFLKLLEILVGNPLSVVQCAKMFPHSVGGLFVDHFLSSTEAS